MQSSAADSTQPFCDNIAMVFAMPVPIADPVVANTVDEILLHTADTSPGAAS